MNLAKLRNYLEELSKDTFYGDLDKAEVVRGLIELDAYVPKDINDNVVLSGTTAATTNSYLTYGVNNVTTASPTAYAIRLPNPPQKGKQVIIVNNSTLPIAVYPSVTGGSINNAVNGVAMVPNDGKSYTFYCYENPLPGGWSWTPPALNQYDSGVITVNTTGGTNVVAASSAANWVEGGGFLGSTAWGYDGKNKALYLPATLAGGDGSAPFKPTPYWNQATKLKVYTNLSATSANVTFGLSEGSNLTYYNISTGAVTGNGASNSGNVSGYGTCNQTVPGASLSAGVLTANVGDPGTCYGELSYSAVASIYQNVVGDMYIGQATVSGTLRDAWYSRYLNFGIQPRQALTGLKFRFFIEYN